MTLNSAIISSTLSALLINRRTGMPWETNHIAQREGKQRSWNVEACHWHIPTPPRRFLLLFIGFRFSSYREKKTDLYCGGGLRFLLLRCCRQSRSDSSRLIQRPMMSLEAMAKEFRESCMIITHMWHRENFRNMCAAKLRTDWKRIMRPSADTDGRAFAAVPRRERPSQIYKKNLAAENKLLLLHDARRTTMLAHYYNNTYRYCCRDSRSDSWL